MTSDDRSAQEQTWDVTYDRLEATLHRFGKEDYLGRADYWLLDEDWGSPQHFLYIHNLHLLSPEIVNQLQHVLKPFPQWELIAEVARRGPTASWPIMGLIVRAHEIVDGLRRDFLPAEIRNFTYEGSRPGRIDV
jgi:hypothetical protein